MSTLGRTRLRLATDTASFDAPLDVLRHATPQFWRGNDVQFELAVFFNGALQDVSNLASLTLEIRPLGANGGPPDPSFTPLMGATISSFDDTTTLDDWNAGTKQQALVAFTAAQSNITAGAAWLSIFAITTDSPGHVITLCAGPIRVLEDGAGLATMPIPSGDTFYTAVESDARYAPLTGGGEVENANLILAGPASGSAAVPTFRALVAADIPAMAESQVTNLVSDLALKAALASPALTGTPTAPTVVTATDSSTKLATTAFVQAAITAAGGGGSGSVTSVALTVPSFLSVSDSPITSAGTLAVSLATQSANLVFAGPGSGSAAAPTFRSLVAADLPMSLTNDTTIIGSPPASSDNSSKIATTAWVRSYTFQIGTDGTDYWIGGSGAISVQSASGTSNAFLSCYGSFAALGSAQLHYLGRSNIDNLDVLIIQKNTNNSHTPIGQSAIDFMSDSCTNSPPTTPNSIYGAIGFDSTGSGYPANGGMYLSFSPPFTAPSFTQPTSGVGKACLVQEGVISSTYYATKALAFNTDWSMSRNDPFGNQQMYMPSTGNSGYYDVNFTQIDDSHHGWGTPLGGTLRMTSSDPWEVLVSVRSNNFDISGLEAFGPNKGMFGSNASAGVSLAAGGSSGLLYFYTGGYAAAKERMRIDSSGNVMIGTTSQLVSALLSVNGTIGIPGGATAILSTASAVTSGAASSTGTLTNAPAAGNPTKWIPFNDAGTTRYIPAW